jgi:TPR repeat protein
VLCSASALIAASVVIAQPRAQSVGSGSQSASEDVQAGIEALTTRNFELGYRLLTTAASEGNARAAVALSSAYLVGLGRPADFGEARRWAQRAANSGDVEGLKVLGFLTLNGYGTPPNPRQALNHFERAAELDDTWSIYYLARLLEAGAPGVLPEPERAASWYELLVLREFPPAMWRLGQILLDGEILPRDYRRAAALLQQAADAGIVPAQASYASMLYRGVGVVQNYPEAFRRFEDAANLGESQARTMTAYMLENGIGTDRDLEQALHHYTRISGDLNPEGLFNFARLILGGALGELSASHQIAAHSFLNLAASRGLSAAEVLRRQIDQTLDPEHINAIQQIASYWRTEWGRRNLRQISSGSGFFISIAGGLLTNHHVVHGCDRVFVRMEDQVRPAEITFAIEEVDLALIHLTPQPGLESDFAVARVARPSEMYIGEPITVFGWPFSGALSNEGVVTTGSLNALVGLRQNPDQVQISANVQPGNSGGPVLGELGRVIGVVMAQYSHERAQQVNFAVSNRTVIEFLRAYEQNFLHGPEDDLDPLPRRTLAELGSQISAHILCYQYPPYDEPANMNLNDIEQYTTIQLSE